MAERTRNWVDAYVAAWQSNEEADIRSLFASGAAYRTSPFAEAWEGLDDIVHGWLARQDIGSDWAFRYEVLAETADTGVVRGWTTYFHPERNYSNLWVITFDGQGRATGFTEWWMTPPAGTGEDG